MEGLSYNNNIYYNICSLVSKLLLSNNISNIDDLNCFDNLLIKIGRENFEEYIHLYIKHFIDEIVYYYNGRKIRPSKLIIIDNDQFNCGYACLKKQSKIKF